MSVTRAPWRSTIELPLTTAAATWIAMFSWRGFTQQSGNFLVHVLLGGVVVVLLGATLRWQRVPGAAVVAVQAVVALVVSNLMIVGSLIPGRELLHRLSTSIDSASTYASPVPHTDTIDVHPLLILGGVAVVLLVDVIACTLGRVSLAGLPLLAVYSVPLSLLGGGLSWWIFALTALLFLLMLFVQEQQQVGRWGRSLGQRGSDRQAGWRPHNHAVRVSATTIGGVAIATAVFVPLAIPTLSLSVFDIGAGSGNGSDININNPMVDLTQELRRGEDVPLLRVTTDDPRPAYLRISVLNRFTGDQWSSGDRSVPAGNRPDGPLPPLAGVDNGIARTTYRYHVTVDSTFHSTWLPTQAPISSITAPGDWRYDTSTMDFIAAQDQLQTAGLSYDMTAVDLHYTAEELAADSRRSTASAVPPELTSLPDNLPGIVSDDARLVTADAATPFEKAVALQSWFRDNFTYDLTKAPVGDGSSELADFLAPGHQTGYCQQFAAAMATMARVLGIPARVAVGFLQPTRVPGSVDTWEYSAHDLHAWPELYFAGAGWVRFDPTPAERVPQSPAYTQQAVQVGNPDQLPTINPNADPEKINKFTPPATSRPRNDPSTPTPSAPRPAAGAGFPWTPVLGGAGGVVVVGGLLLLPRTVRSRRRTRRLAGDAEDAWAELRAGVIDLRLAWPEDRSPRATRDHLVGSFGRSGRHDPAYRPAHGPAQAPDAVEALDRIVLEVERSRYARAHPVGRRGRLADDVRTCIAALAAGVTPRARTRATWLPASLAPQRRKKAARRPDTGSAAGGIVEHI